MNNKENKPSSALISYAVLAEKILSGGDLLQSLMPFFRPIAASYAGEYFEPGKFCRKAAELYALQIPKLTAMGWCERLVNEGFLELHARTITGNLYRYPVNLPIDTDIPAGVSEQQVIEFLESFRAFARQSPVAEFATLADEVLDEALFTRLLNIDSMKILSRRDMTRSIKSNPTTLSLKVPESNAEERHEIHIDFLVAEYLLHLEATDGQKFQVATAVAFGNMAAEALATFREPPAKDSTDLSGMRLYLDTPLVLDLFELNDGFEGYAKDLSNLLSSSGVKVAVFDHSVEEVQNVIYARLNFSRSSANQFSIAGSRTLIANRLAMLNGNVASQLERLGIEIDRDPEISLLRISQKALGSVQVELDRKMSGWKNDAKHYDEKSIFSIISLRNRQRAEPDFARCKFALLTRNTPLTFFANSAWRQWLQESGDESKAKIERTAPIAVSDKQLSGLLWMLKGGASEGLSKVRMISHCSFAIRPRPDVIARACNLIVEAHGRDKGEEFAALLSERRAEQALMRAAAGDPEELTSKNLPEIIRKVILAAGDDAAAAERERADEEARLAAKVHEEEISQKLVALDDQSKRASLAEEALRSLEIQVALDKTQQALVVAAAKRENLRHQLFQKQEELRNVTHAFSNGEQSYNRTKLGIVVLFLLLSIFGMTYDGKAALIFGAVCSISLGFLGFWYLPNVALEPICEKAGRARATQFLALHGLGLPLENETKFRDRRYSWIENLELNINTLQSEIDAVGEIHRRP
jgi:hypothetical protein